MKRASQGKYVNISTAGDKAQAYIPNPLPPNPPTEWTPELRNKFDQALLALGRLDSVSTLLLNTSLFLHLHIRKEAVLSSMIEGTKSSLSDLLLYELGQKPQTPLHDVQEVSNYVSALNHGLDLLQSGLPISLRLFREVHAVLLAREQDSGKSPGEFRHSQNWIGGPRPSSATFVPPPPEAVLECMSQLELFLNDQPEPTPVLLKAALAHLQFETIHPFLDGNGRLGRLLITFLLHDNKVLREPTLYLSLHIKKHRQRYYKLLDGVRQTGDWEAWLDFFAEAVIVAATQVVETVQQLMRLSDTDRTEIKGLGRGATSALQIHSALIERPIATSGLLATKTGVSPATANKSLAHLQTLGIVREITAQKRNRLFSYRGCLDILNNGTEPF